MVKGIRIYIEGGARLKDSKGQLRAGFSVFFKDIKQLAKNKGMKWDIIMGGSGTRTIKNVVNSIEHNPEYFHILLVDSDTAIPRNNNSINSLRSYNKSKHIGLKNENCHFMVQVMESWFIADIDTLKECYGNKFNSNPIPKNSNVEKIEKSEVYTALKEATRHTQMGKYNEIHHAKILLECINPDVVKSKSWHCKRLFDTLTNIIQNN